MKFFAHSSNKKGSPWEPLREHIELVANLAGTYAAPFGAGQEAHLAGLFHDLGKYTECFLRRLKNEISGLDHWSPGSLAVLYRYKQKAIAAALAIHGHHTGLQEGSAEAIKSGMNIHKLSDRTLHPFELELTSKDIDSLLERFGQDGLNVPQIPSASIYDLDPKAASGAAMLDARMLFSALVDADYVATEAHFDGDADGAKIMRESGPKLDAARSRKILHQHIENLRTNTQAAEDVRQMRASLLADCQNAGEEPQGLFTLTAPTGAGKTLSMLEFALSHAEKHEDIRRIIVVIPFLSIIDQTAKTYRQLLEPTFGPHYVLEHHSLAGVTKKRQDDEPNRDNEEESRRTAGLLAENWDAPIILTTSVQFFESLFANRPAKCRKLHRLANSVIMFDEVQTLPPRIAVPSLAGLSRLTERYGCTVVFSTATQPAFNHLHEQVTKLSPEGWQPNPIVKKPEKLFDRARRVRVDWRINDPMPWDNTADELAKDENRQSLCIVNLKRHAQQLAAVLQDKSGKDGLFHLSSSMCPAHRKSVLDEVRERLDQHRICRLISTQCIEAGVDVDFPVTWRALGPLDSIAQAAGRCNREGRFDGKGRMVVFMPEKERAGEYLYPPGGYKEATETAVTLLRLKESEAGDESLDIYDPALFERYYHLLYDLTGTPEFDPDRNELADAIQRRSFVDVAKHYRLIDQGTISVLVPYDEEMTLFDSLKDRLEKEGRLTRQWILDARPLTVSLYRPKNGHAVWHYLDPVPLGRGQKADDWFIYIKPEHYDSLVGLKPPDKVDNVV